MDFLFANGDLDGGAMPSSHVAGALVVVIYAFKYLKSWFWATLGLFIPMTFSTVYNSYHYATDIIAGLIAGWLLYRIGRAFFKAVDPFPTDTEYPEVSPG
jgi:membrane-associated phospholipid phosphatase